MRITVDQLKPFNPCRDFAHWFQGRENPSLYEILCLEHIPVFDRMWCVTRFLTPAQSCDFAIHCAEQIKKQKKIKGATLTQAIKKLRQYREVGLFTEELEAVRKEMAAICRGTKDRDTFTCAKLLMRACEWGSGFWLIDHPVVLGEIEQLKVLVLDVDTDLTASPSQP